MVARAFVVWLLILGGEVLHGITRAALLEPHVGDARARQIGVLTGSLIILTLAAASIRWIGATTHKELAAVGVLWLVLTLTFEMAFGRLALGYTWERLWADYDLTRGGFLAIGMVFLAIVPFLAAKLRGWPGA